MLVSSILEAREIPVTTLRLSTRMCSVSILFQNYPQGNTSISSASPSHAEIPYAGTSREIIYIFLTIRIFEALPIAL